MPIEQALFVRDMPAWTPAVYNAAWKAALLAGK
jgi:hypothetical protein